MFHHECAMKTFDLRKRKMQYEPNPQGERKMGSKTDFCYICCMAKNQYLERAIRLALQNVEAGGGPFGALVVKEGVVIAEGVNDVTRQNDPTAHAEVQAIRNACQKLGTFDLSDCELYSSCEPCPMCFSALYWARISRVYFSATHQDAAQAGFNDSFIYSEIRKKMEQRSIPFIRLSIPESEAPFRQWIEKNDKTPY